MFLDVTVERQHGGYFTECPMLRARGFADSEEQARDFLIEQIERSFKLECPYDFQMYEAGLEMKAEVLVNCLNQLLLLKEKMYLEEIVDQAERVVGSFQDRRDFIEKILSKDWNDSSIL